MSNWKRVVVFGSIGIGAILLLRGRRSAGAAAATVGLVLLAGEYPEQFERVWEEAPEYLYRGTQIFSSISRLIERTAEDLSRRAMIAAPEEAGGEYGT